MMKLMAEADVRGRFAETFDVIFGQVSTRLSQSPILVSRRFGIRLYLQLRDATRAVGALASGWLSEEWRNGRFVYRQTGIMVKPIPKFCGYSHCVCPICREY
jgi:hypothetical protein